MGRLPNKLGILTKMKINIFFFLFFSTILTLYSAPVETRFSFGGLVLGAKESAYHRSSEQFRKELRIRTHIDPKDKNSWVWLNEKTIKNSPPFIWIVIGSSAKITPELVSALQRFLFSGGTAFVEAESSHQAQGALNDLRNQVFYKKKISEVKKKTLLTRTYYIISDNDAKSLKTIQYASRSLWIESNKPVLKRITPHYDASRESAIRKATNIVLYTLTGSYKDDLTHLKYLMRRKKH